MCRTFGKAAEILNVTPSTISRNLQDLEKEVGMLLVDRQKGVKCVKLTPSGEAFLPQILKWQKLKNEITGSYKKSTALFLSIGGCECAINSLLPRLFNALLAQTPPVHLKIITDPTDNLYEKVENREIDVGFVVHEEPSKFVKIASFHKDEMIVARFDGEKKSQNELLELKNLNTKDELYIEWSNSFRLWHERIWDPLAGAPVQLLSASLLPSLMTRKGQWSLIPQCAMSLFNNESKQIKSYSTVEAIPELNFYTLTHRAPKASALPGLAILRNVLNGMGFTPMGVSTQQLRPH